MLLGVSIWTPHAPVNGTFLQRQVIPSFLFHNTICEPMRALGNWTGMCSVTCTLSRYLQTSVLFGCDLILSDSWKPNYGSFWSGASNIFCCPILRGYRQYHFQFHLSRKVTWKECTRRENQISCAAATNTNDIAFVKTAGRNGLDPGL